MVKPEQEELNTLISDVEALIDIYEGKKDVVMGRKKEDVLLDALEFLYSYKVIMEIKTGGGDPSRDVVEELSEAAKNLSRVSKGRKKSGLERARTREEVVIEVNLLITALEAFINSCDRGMKVNNKGQGDILEGVLRFVYAYKVTLVMDNYVPSGDDMSCFPGEIMGDVNRLIELNKNYSEEEA